MSRGRIAMLVVILAAAAAAAFHVISGAGNAPASEVIAGGISPKEKPIALTRSGECRACHEDVFAEWRSSHHAMAYTNPEVQKLSKGFQDRDCLPCHLPRPVWETGFDTRVLERAFAHDDGVDCFTCHHLPAANVMVGRGPPGPAAATAPCQPAASPEIGSLGLCAPCHNQHKVHEEWKQTAFAEAGPDFKDCNDCHMPRVERKAVAGAPPRAGRSHAFPAAHDPAMLRSAGKMSVVDGGPGQLLVTVVNDGCGHNFPTDERHRAVDLVVFASGAGGKGAQARIDRFRNPYRQEFGLKNPLRTPGAERDYREPLGDFGEVRIHAVRVAAPSHPQEVVWYPESTQIPAGESRSYTVLLPSAVRQATVRLYYRIHPDQSDEEAVLLHESTVRWE